MDIGILVASTAKTNTVDAIAWAVEEGGYSANSAINLNATPRSSSRVFVVAGATRRLVAIVLILFSTAVAHAGTWYLMAADRKLMSNPSVADRLFKGSRLGPITLASLGEYSSRAECEPARQKLVDEWRKHSVNKRGSWDKYGVTSPGGFIRCVPDTDPHLAKAPPDDQAKGGHSLEVFLQVRAVR